MMEIPILSDRSKLDKWGEICVNQDWAGPEELEKWLAIHGVMFTGAGSCLGTSLMTMKVSTPEQADQIIKMGTGEEYATRILETMSGLLIFSDSDSETAFWKAAIERLNVEADMFMPPEIMPKSVRESLKYPADNNQGTVS
jgi:hypothetical protein